MEVELKLLIDPQHLEAVRKHPLLKKYAIAKPRQLRMADTYFDTPRLHIRRCDAGLRVRQLEHGWIQTMKGGGSVEGGLHQRHEWESRVSGPTPDLAALRDLVDHHSPWGRLLRSTVMEDRLSPIFTTRISRTVWQLRLPQGDLLELALDHGSLEHDGKKEPINEIELELKSGHAKSLFEFALQLQETIPLHIGNLSKADRGYAFHAPPSLAAVKATPLELSRQMPVEQAYRTILANCMRQVQANEAGVMHGHDPETVHQMRVGLRRLGSALKLFEAVVRLPQAMQEDFGWLATQLGAARDWDVLAHSTLAKINDAEPAHADLAALRAAALDQAEHMREAAAAALNSPRYARLILGFHAWLEGAGWRDADADAERLETPLGKFARSALDRAHRRLLKRGQRLHTGTPETRHRARIAAKKTRYAAEFFQSLYPPKRVRPFVAALSDLQDVLGGMNDAVIADGLLDKLRQQEAGLAEDTGFVRGYLAAHTESEIARMRKLWKKFKPMPAPCTT
jgi:inorganic triphosphatase YgiF